MKIGLENKKEVIIAVVIAGFAVWYGFHQFGSGGNSAPSTPSSNNAAVRSNVRPRSQQKAPATVAAPSLDPRLKLDLLRSSEQIAYAGTGRNIFQDMQEKLPVPAVRPGPKPGPTPPPGPPPPPPINLKFFGFANRPGEAKQIFLMKGEDVFIAKQGDIVDRQYKVVEIRANEVVIQDLLNNNTQNIPLTAG